MLFVGMVAFALDTFMKVNDRPLVYKTKLTGQCLAMDTPEGLKQLGGDCYGLPALRDEKRVDDTTTFEMIRTTVHIHKHRM